MVSHRSKTSIQNLFGNFCHIIKLDISIDKKLNKEKARTKLKYNIKKQ